VVKPVAGEVVVIPFPRTDPAGGKRRPALVIEDLPGPDLILCQITSRAHSDAYSVPLDTSDFERGQLPQQAFIRPQRLFTLEHRIILNSVGKVNAVKLDEVLGKVREFFN
jgi:mRNA interferase MazF